MSINKLHLNTHRTWTMINGRGVSNRGQPVRLVCATIAMLMATLVIGIDRTQAQQLPTIVHPMQIGQVDWDMPDPGAVPVPNSEFGHLRFDFTPGSDLYFMNLTARLPNDPPGTAQWMVQNMPILPAGVLQTPMSETANVLDLRMLGVSRGEEWFGREVQYSVSFSPVPVPSQPPFSLTATTLIGDFGYRFGGDIGALPPVPRPKVPVPTRPQKLPWNGQFLPLKAAARFGMPNGEQGDDQCGPSAIANSMHWLQARYPRLVNLGGQTWNETLAKLKTDTNWRAPVYDPTGKIIQRGGISQRDAIEGKLRFIQRAGKTFPPGFVVKYQADAGLTDLGASVTVGAKTANRVGAGGAPTFAFLCGELQAGEDVEISLDYLNNDGTKLGGHVMTITGCLQFGNKMYVWTNDDGTQGRKTGSPPIPPVNSGLRTNLAHQITIENGYMRLAGEMLGNRIKAIYSESIPEPATLAMLAIGALLFARRPSRQTPATRGLTHTNTV